jgi:hypothetical protein
MGLMENQRSRLAKPSPFAMGGGLWKNTGSAAASFHPLLRGLSGLRLTPAH